MSSCRCGPGRRTEVRAGLARLAAARHLNLEPADFDATLFAVASTPAQQSEGLFSVISAIVGFLFAFNAMLLTVPERRRMIEAMRRRGATRTMTVQALMFDALVIGVLACVLGLLIGELLSIEVFHAQPGYLSFAFPVGSQRVVTWPTVALAVGAGLLAAFVGVMAPLRDILARPLRFSAAAERAPRGWTVFRLAAGTVCLAITTLILIFRPQAAAVGSFTLIAAMLALLPFLFDGIVVAFKHVQRHFHAASTVLALEELQDPLTRVRSLAVAATGAIAVFGSVAISGSAAQPAERAESHGLRMEPRHRPVGVALGSRQHAGDDPVPGVGRVEADPAAWPAQRGHLPRKLPRRR